MTSLRARVAAVLAGAASVAFLAAVPPSYAAPQDQPGLVAPAEESVPNSAPQAWARACNSATLGLGGSKLELAPILGDEKRPDGGFIHATPDSRGRFVPVVFVHGWNSKDIHTSARDGAFSRKIDLTQYLLGPRPAAMRSLIGQIQNVPGATAFTYDYEASHSRWVTNDPIGPGLGRAIDCLYRASGEKVVVIGHSMGGLAARQAIGAQADGSDRSSEVSTVITFGTPNTGSFAATLGGAVADAGPYEVETILHLIVSACENVTDLTDPGASCRYLPDFLGVVGGEAAAAMKIGSRQLGALPVLPKAVNLVALAGRMKIAVPKVGLFAAPWDTVDVEFGDGVVLAGSALGGGPDTTSDIDCRYQMSPVRGATDKLGLTFGLTSRQDAAQSPLATWTSPCFHSHLMRARELTNEALGSVNDDIQRRQNDHGKAPQLGIPASERNDPSGTRTPIQVVLDRSDSMGETVSSGTTGASVRKIDAAKSAVLDLIERSDRGQELGVLAYPGGSNEIEGCTSGQEIVRLGALDRGSAQQAVRKLGIEGGTPTAPALLRAAEIMERRGVMNGVIVLVSDGESNCGTTPVCDVADELRNRGFELTVNSVGFDIAADSVAAEELRCVADATGGVYLEATDAEALREQILKAAGSSMTIDAAVPEQMPTVVGGGSSGDTAVEVSVTNDSKLDATDVRVALDFIGSDGVGGAILVTRPIRFLGNIAPGETRAMSYAVHPDPAVQGKTLVWRATVTSRNGAASMDSGKTTFVRQDPSQLSGVLQGVQRPVILGDSYSSGEGGGRYVRGTDEKTSTSGNLCHRSPATYGLVLFESAELLACSGAVTAHLNSPQSSGGGSVEPQLDRLEELMDGDAPDAALLTFGGNDIGFADIITGCTLSPKCNVPSGFDYAINPAAATSIDHGNKLMEIYALQTRLERAYDDIDAILNSPEAVKERGREAPIVVLPYARITPHDESALSACQAGINVREMPFLNDILDALDLVIGNAVGQLARRGRPVYFARDVQEAFQPNHTICDGTETYAVKATAAELAGRLADKSRKNELMHPNERGYEAIATALSNWSRATTARATTPRRDGEEVDVAPQGFLGATWSAMTRTALGPVAEPGASLSVSGDGFAPGTQAVVWLESYPTPIGAVQVDARGRVDGEVRLPKGTPPGSHHLVTVGSDPDGNVRTTSRGIRVVPVLTLEAVAGALLGVALVLLGWRRRKRHLASE